MQTFPITIIIFTIHINRIESISLAQVLDEPSQQRHEAMGDLGLGTEKRGQTGINSQVAATTNYSPTIISREARDEIKFCFEDNTPLSCPGSIN